MESLLTRLRPPVTALLLALPAIGVAAEGVTVPPLTGTPEQFKAALGDTDVELIGMAPGDRRTFD